MKSMWTSGRVSRFFKYWNITEVEKYWKYTKYRKSVGTKGHSDSEWKRELLLSRDEAFKEKI
jgi:hypothetical protein